MSEIYPETPAVRVHVVRSDVPMGDGRPRRKRRALKTNTFTLTAANPTVRVMPQADSRVEGWITSAVTAAPAELNPANPAVATSFVYTNNTGAPQQITSIHASLTTDATVLNRFIFVQVMDTAGKILWSANNGTAVAASSTIAFNGYVNASQQNSASGNFTFPLPASGGLIPAGGTLTIGAGSFGAADQISGVNLILAAAAPVIFIATGQADANSQTGGAAQISGTDTTPFPVNTTAPVWVSAAAPFPVTVSVVQVYEELE